VSNDPRWKPKEDGGRVVRKRKKGGREGMGEGGGGKEVHFLDLDSSVVVA